MSPPDFRHVALCLAVGLIVARFAFGLQELLLKIPTPEMTQVASALIVAVFMSSFLELWSRRAQRVAVRAVLLRYEQGADTAAESLTVLQALGLADTPAEPTCAPLSTRQRRQAARRAERANDDRSSA